MGAMKNLDVRLRTIEEKLDLQLHLMQDMVKLEGKIERVETAIEGTQSRMMDRLVELAMVKQGAVQEATVHRAQSRLENQPVNTDEWEDKEEKWPPEGCTVVDINH